LPRATLHKGQTIVRPVAAAAVAATTVSTFAAVSASASAGVAPPPLGRFAATSAAAVGGAGSDGSGGTLRATAAVRSRHGAERLGIAVAIVYASTVPASDDVACAGSTRQITEAEARRDAARPELLPRGRQWRRFRRVLRRGWRPSASGTWSSMGRGPCLWR